MLRGLRRLCGCILVAAALLPACASREQRFAEHVERAERHAAEGRIPEALLEYQSALEIDPRDAGLHQRIGDLLVRRRDFKDAISYYRQAFELDPERIDAAMSEARLLAFSDRERARELVARVLERGAELSDVQILRAHVALASGVIDEALAGAQKAVALDPTSSAAWTQLGKVEQARIRKHQIAGKLAPPEVFQSALDAFAHVDRIESGDAHARVERGRIFASWGGRSVEALASYRAALTLATQQGDAEGRHFAAKAFDEFAKKQNDVALRREALRAIIAADETDYEAWERLTRLADGQRPPRGEAVCLELLTKRPDDPRSHRLFVSYLLRKRRLDDAIAHLRGAIARNPGIPQLWEQLVTVQIRGRQLANARTTLADLTSRFPDDPVTRGAEARVAVAEGRVADAAKTLRELVKTSETPEYQRLLALAEQRLGEDLPAAVAAIDRTLELDPHSPEHYRLKARIHFDARQWGQVLYAYRALAAVGRHLTPQDELRRATALYETGNVAAGRAALDAILARTNPPVGAAVEFARREGPANYAAARKLLIDASERAPNDPSSFDALVQLEFASGHSDAALALIDRAAASGRIRPRLLLLRVQILVARGDLAAAEAEMLRLFAAAPTLPGGAELLFDIYRRQGKLSEAQRSFEQADGAGLLHPGTRLLLARLYLSHGELAKAQPLLETVIVEQPGLASARNDLAFVLASRGEQLDRALELARGARVALGDNASAIDTLGYVNLRAGRFDDALAEFERAVALGEARPEGAAPTHRYHLGLALEALGRKREAADAFERALAGSAAFPEADDARRRLDAARASPPPNAEAS